jgi:acyl-CoA thioesterase
MTAQFGEVLDSLRRDGSDWVANVGEDWSQGRTIFGGLQVALAVRAMRGVMTGNPGAPLRSVQATFVGPLPFGTDIRLRAELLRTGKSASHARCDLLHDGAVACTVAAIFGAPRQSGVVIEIPRPVVAVDPETLPDLPCIPGVTPTFVKHIQVRWAEGTPPYTSQREPRSLIYSRMLDRDCAAEDALIALADSIPSPALSMLSRIAPASSLNWMLELIGDPGLLDREQWALIGTEVRAGMDGYLSQTSVLWGPTGHAFSVSHQSVAIFG